MKLCPLCEAEYEDDVVRCPSDNETLVYLRDEEDNLVGSVLNGRYRLVEKIGEGGMGSVYRGIQEPVERPVAIKVLRSDLASNKEVVRRFFNEARVVSRLRHPNTVTLYDFGQSAAGDLYIAMEYLTGKGLATHISEGQLTLPEVLEITDQICQSLEEAHNSGIVHRDLKPDNIFIDRVGSGNIVKVLDFGIAKVSHSSDNLTKTGTIFGTPAYMSPEQAQGHHIDTRSDIYTLGIVIYEMLAGEPPFIADNPMQVALRQVTATPRPIMDMSRLRPLPLKLSGLVMAMLEKDTSHRPQTVSEVRRAILEVAEDQPGAQVQGYTQEAPAVALAEPTDTFPEAWRGQTVLDTTGEHLNETEPTAVDIDDEVEAARIAVAPTVVDIDKNADTKLLTVMPSIPQQVIKVRPPARAPAVSAVLNTDEAIRLVRKRKAPRIAAALAVLSIVGLIAAVVIKNRAENASLDPAPTEAALQDEDEQETEDESQPETTPEPEVVVADPVETPPVGDQAAELADLDSPSSDEAPSIDGETAVDQSDTTPEVAVQTTDEPTPDPEPVVREPRSRRDRTARQTTPPETRRDDPVERVPEPPVVVEVVAPVVVEVVDDDTDVDAESEERARPVLLAPILTGN